MPHPSKEGEEGRYLREMTTVAGQGGALLGARVREVCLGRGRAPPILH